MAEETSPMLLSSFVFYHLQKYPYAICLAVFTCYPQAQILLFFLLTALPELVSKKLFFPI